MIDYPMHCAARCGAKTRKGTPCEAPAIRGRARCRMHGGKSPGRPQIHGRFTKAYVQKTREWRRVLRDLQRLLEQIDPSGEPNVTTRPRQVNNGITPARAREVENDQPKLLETQHGERLDTGASGKTIGANSAMATVGEIDRTENVTGQGKGL